METPFLGGTYVARSRNLAYNRAVNIFPETVDTQEGKAVAGFFGAPGLKPLVTVGNDQPQRGSIAVGAFLYSLHGDTLYKVDSNYNATANATTIGTTAGNVSMIQNNEQIMISDGSAGYCLTIATDVLAAVPSFPAGAQLLVTQDEFGITNIAGTEQWFQSNLNDFSEWDALNFSSADAQPDPIVSMVDMHREVWLLGGGGAEVWLNAGLPGFAFQRLSGIYLETGCCAPWSACNVDETAMWLGKQKSGHGIVYRSNGYAAKRVSTHAIEYAIGTYSDITDAIAYSYQVEGHWFYVLTFPTGNATWVYDTITELWHERAAFSDGSFQRQWPMFCSFFNTVQVVGDRRNGNLYELDLDTYTDNGQTRKWMRSWRALPPNKSTDKPLRFNSLSIDAQAGINIPQDLNPQFMLEWSDDGGYNWSNIKTAPAGKAGETSPRTVFTRLGQTKSNTGLDRIFRLSGTDPIPVALIGADVDYELT